MMTSLISFMNSLKVLVKNKYFDMELCSSDPYGATDYTDDDHIVARDFREIDDIFDLIYLFIKGISE